MFYRKNILLIALFAFFVPLHVLSMKDKDNNLSAPKGEASTSQKREGNRLNIASEEIKEKTTDTQEESSQANFEDLPFELKCKSLGMTIETLQDFVNVLLIDKNFSHELDVRTCKQMRSIDSVGNADLDAFNSLPADLKKVARLKTLLAESPRAWKSSGGYENVLILAAQWGDYRLVEQILTNPLLECRVGNQIHRTALDKYLFVRDKKSGLPFTFFFIKPIIKLVKKLQLVYKKDENKRKIDVLEAKPDKDSEEIEKLAKMKRDNEEVTQKLENFSLEVFLSLASIGRVLVQDMGITFDSETVMKFKEIDELGEKSNDEDESNNKFDRRIKRLEKRTELKSFFFSMIDKCLDLFRQLILPIGGFHDAILNKDLDSVERLLVRSVCPYGNFGDDAYKVKLFEEVYESFNNEFFDGKSEEEIREIKDFIKFGKEKLFQICFDFFLGKIVTIKDIFKSLGLPECQQLDEQVTQINQALIPYKDLIKKVFGEEVFDGDTISIKHVMLLLLSPLHAAVYQGDINMVKAFVKSGMNVNKECLGMTPLCIAVTQDNQFVAQYLLENGAKIKQKRTYDGKTALDIAMLSQNLKMILLLAQHGHGAK